MPYPPVPYPPLSALDSCAPSQIVLQPREADMGGGKSEEQVRVQFSLPHLGRGLTVGEVLQTTQQPLAPPPTALSMKHTFRSPFKSPTISRPPFPSQPSVSITLPSLAETAVTTVTPRTLPSAFVAPLPPSTPRSSRRSIPFKSPARSSSAPSTSPPAVSAAVEISQLERRVAQLRQARRYQLATERGEKDGEEELERLCEKWKEAGKLAAELLFERVGSPDPTLSILSSSSSSTTVGFASISAPGHHLSHPILSSWDSSPPTSDSFGSTSSSRLSASRRPTTAEVVDRFDHTLSEAAKRRGTSKATLLSELEESEGGRNLETPDRVIGRLMKKQKTGFPKAPKRTKVKQDEGGGRKKRKVEVDRRVEVEVKEESEDELLGALDELIAVSPSAREVDSAVKVNGDDDDAHQDHTGPSQAGFVIQDDRAESTDAKERQNWNVGTLLESVGIDPGLFGWAEGYEGFHDASKARGDFANFLGGFASSTSKLTIVVPPASRVSGSVERVAQLANFYLPLPFVSTVFLGTTESDSFLDVLQALPRAQREKLVLLETEANKHTRLIVEGGFATLAVEPGLFATKTEELNGTGEENGDGRDTEPSSPASSGGTAAGSHRPSRERFEPTDELPAPLSAPTGAFKPPKVLFQHGPKPCRDFYLYAEGCSKGTFCHHSHSYPFTEKQWRDFPAHIKGMICPSMRDFGVCKWEEKCYMGHRCPFTAQKCPFKKHCHFRLAGLPHSQEAAAAGIAGTWSRGKERPGTW
ncbi:hypothetical protein JCM11641_008184 [Rhodosporidiobolus odoratus]